MGLEHQVELADAGKILLAAHGADDVMLGNVLFQLLVGPAVAGLLALGEIFNQLVCAEASLAGLAVHQWIVEAAHVAGSHPDFPVHQNGRVQTHVVFAFLNELLPPGLFHVVFEFHAQRAVVPAVGQTAVNFAAGENKAAPLAKRNQFIHRQCCHGVHSSSDSIPVHHSWKSEICQYFDGESARFLRMGGEKNVLQ